MKKIELICHTCDRFFQTRHMTQIRGCICHTGDSYDRICHTCREFFIRETNTFPFSHVKRQIRTYSQTLPRVRIGQKCTDSFEI